MRKLAVLALFLACASVAGAQSITTSPLTVGPLPASFGSAHQHVAFSGNLTSSGIIGGVPPYVCSKVSGSFPTGIADVTSGCLVAGTPTGTASGTEVVKIADSGNSSVVLSITINVATISSITASIQGSGSSSILVGNQTQLTCLSTWSDLSGLVLTSVATWATSNAGVFTVNTGGSFPGLVTGVGAGSANATCAFNSLTSPNLAITVTSSNPVVVTTATLPHCQQKLAYQGSGFQLAASGGSPPYTWTQTSGTLPTGLLLSSSGIISGNCTGSTASGLVFKATDTLAANGSSGSLTLTVATLASIAVTPASPTINAGAQEQFTATGTYSDSSTANLSNGNSGLGLIGTSTSGSSGATTGTSSATPAFSAIASNLLWVECFHGTDTTSTCTPTDTASNSFTSIATKTNTPNGLLETFYAKNITGNANDVVTCTFNNPVAHRVCAVHQIAGASTTAPLDSSSVVSAASSTPSNAATTPSFSTATANEVEDVAFAIDSASVTVTPGTGYALRISGADAGTEDQIFSGTQASVTASASWTGSALDWIIVGQAFEAASAGNGCQWTSSVLTVATVGASGLATAGTGNGGTSSIQCTVGAVNGSTTLTVTPSAITSLALTPISGTIAIGQQIAFTCTDNNQNNVTSSATFGSNNAGVFAMGSPNGTGTGEAAGSAQVTCSKSGITSNAAAITVQGAGQIITAASCNLTDVQAAVNLASDGYTVQIPNGTCSWTSGISTTKQIWIRAQNYTATPMGSLTRNVTLINNSTTVPLFSMTSGNSFHVRISGIYFQESATPAINHINLNGSGTQVPLLDDDTIEVASRFGNEPGIAAVQLGSQGGVMWNAYVIGVATAGVSSGECCPDGASIHMSSPQSWYTADTLGTQDTNGTANFYIETSTLKNFGQGPDCDDNCRMVLRYDILDGLASLTHGLTSAFGGRQAEIYNNTIETTTADRNLSGRYYWDREGVWVIHDNTVAYQNVGYGTPTLFTTIVECGGGVSCANDGSVPYPVLQNTAGVGTGGEQTSWTCNPCTGTKSSSTPVNDPSYIWNNCISGHTLPCAGDSTYGFGTSPFFVQLNRDVFVDSGAKPGYVPYTYPHPLTQNSGPPPAGISFSPPNINFGAGLVGGSPVTATLTITNTGSGNNTISSITVSGAQSSDFTFTPATCSAVPILITPGASCTLTVTFTPGAAGTRSGQLNFTDSAGAQPVVLSGTGTTGGSAVTIAGHVIQSSACANNSTTCALSSFTVAHTGDAVKVTFKFCMNGFCNAAPTGTFSLSDGTNTYTLITAASSSSSATFNEYTWVAKNVTAGAYVITLTASADHLYYIGADIEDLQGASLTTPVDASVSNVVTMSTASASITSAGNVTNANEVVLVTAVCLQGNQVITNTSSTYSTLDASSTDSVLTMDLVHPSSGAPTTANNACSQPAEGYSASMVAITP